LLLGTTALAACAVTPGSALARLVADPRRIDMDWILHNRITRESVRIDTATSDAVVFDWNVGVGGRIPFEHWHGDQDEVFTIKRGTMRFWLNGEMMDLGAGQTLRVNKGVNHVGKNISDEPVEAVVRLEPGLDGLEVFQIYWGLCEDGHVNKKGHPKVMLLAALTAHLEGRHCPSHVPTAAYEVARRMLRRAVDKPRNRDLFERYTGRLPLLDRDQVVLGTV